MVMMPAAQVTEQAPASAQAPHSPAATGRAPRGTTSGSCTVAASWDENSKPILQVTVIFWPTQFRSSPRLCSVLGKRAGK